MALNKISRVLSLPPGEAAHCLPPEVVKMAGQLKSVAGGMKKELTVGDLDPKLKPKTAERNFDRNRDFKRKSTIPYVPPSER